MSYHTLPAAHLELLVTTALGYDKVRNLKVDGLDYAEKLLALRCAYAYFSNNTGYRHHVYEGATKSVQKSIKALKAVNLVPAEVIAGLEASLPDIIAREKWENIISSIAFGMACAQYSVENENKNVLDAESMAERVAFLAALKTMLA